MPHKDSHPSGITYSHYTVHELGGNLHSSEIMTTVFFKVIRMLSDSVKLCTYCNDVFHIAISKPQVKYTCNTVACSPLTTARRFVSKTSIDEET